MTVKLHELSLRCRGDWITPEWRSYRPPSWPPPDDWPVAEDRHGKTLAIWTDPIWPLAGSKFSLNFGDGPIGQAEPIDPANANLLRLYAGWIMWGLSARTEATTIHSTFYRLRPIFALCSRNNILASDLMRFPRLLDEVAKVLAPSTYAVAIAELHRLHDARMELGYVLVNPDGITRLMALRPDYAGGQTSYIPPRIWTYQVLRLRECLDDFLAHSQQVEACFTFCLDGYRSNYGSLESAFTSTASTRGPFNSGCQNCLNCTYLGPFEATAKRFGVFELMERWGAPDSQLGWTLAEFSKYLSLVSYAGLMYIGSFTLQRKEELNALRVDCLTWEHDEKLGRVALICGETTKTDPDSDARWVASPSVEVAVRALSFITAMQMPCIQANAMTQVTSADLANPYLRTSAQEPWASGKSSEYSIRSELRRIGQWLLDFPKLFDQDQLRINEADLKIARHLTPTLPADTYAVGQVWPLAWHQYRRTGAVNMTSSGILSDSTLQQQLKHKVLPQSLYYRRNFTRLRLNTKVQNAVIAALYEAQAHAIRCAMSDRFVGTSPERNKSALRLISVADHKKLISYAKKGTVAWRTHILGGCMKAGACEYGGVESIARCAGGDGGEPCTDVFYDREQEPMARAELKRIAEEMARLPEGSPRYGALFNERRGFENFLHAIQ